MLKRIFSSKSKTRRTRRADEELIIPPSVAATEGGRLLEQAKAFLKDGHGVEAMRASERAVRAGTVFPGVHLFRARCLLRVGRHEEAVAALDAELALNPGSETARALRDRYATALAPNNPAKTDAGPRSWHTSLPFDTLQSIQKSLHNYSYRGVPMLKNPFDVALYPMLLWELKPQTIFEIGSKSGGSGLWFGDLLNSFSISAHIYSVDIVRVDAVNHPRVTFIEGDGRRLEQTFTPAQLEKLPRPWLVIEDADHEYETSIAVLNFFDTWLKPGEVIVVEDGIISDLVQDEDCNSGPHRALKEFLGHRSAEYSIDSRYCDFFGHNLTWASNGFLRKHAPRATAGQSQ